VDPTKIETTATPTTPTAVPTTTQPTSAPPTTSPPPADSCQVTYRIIGQWPGGFQGEVRITPGRALMSWTVGWTFPNGQRIQQGWSGTFAQSGAAVTVTNVAWNGGVPANGSVMFGFIASWTGTNGLPTSFTLNGSVCLA
jgi:endo-1,4-beta-xylanase